MTAESNATVAVEWIERLDRARVLIETAWMDDEPIPCEVTARNIVRDIVGEMRQRAALRTPATTPAADPFAPTQVGELVHLTYKLVRALRKASPGNELADKAMDYVKRKGIGGSVFRSSDDGTPATTGEGEVERAARIIDPHAWQAFDAAIRPYAENRGSGEGEQFYYRLTWDRGCRSVEDVRAFFLTCRDHLLPMDVYRVQDSITKAHNILAALPPSSGWQPIETAPKMPGHTLILCSGSMVGEAYWDRINRHWRWVGDAPVAVPPSHWQPLPPPPSREG